MTAEVITSNSICDYCKNRDDYYNGREFHNSCPLWYKNEICRDAEDFIGKELIEVEI